MPGIVKETMNRKKLKLFLALAFAVATLLSWVVLVMIEENYKRGIVAALKANDTKEAIKLCYSWQKSGADVTSSPLFFMAKAKTHLKNGNTEAVRVNLDKAIELLGK